MPITNDTNIDANTPPVAAGQDHMAVFAAVMGGHKNKTTREPDLVVPAAAASLFINICDTAIWGLLVETDELVPGLEIKEQRAMVKAYLLFLANEAHNCARQGTKLDPDRVVAWWEGAPFGTWDLLGFEDDPPLLSVQLAFSLIRSRKHISLALWMLLFAVEHFAANGLFQGLRQ